MRAPSSRTAPVAWTPWSRNTPPSTVIPSALRAFPLGFSSRAPGAAQLSLDAGPQQPHRPGGVEPLVEEHISLHCHPSGAEGVPVGVLEPGAG